MHALGVWFNRHSKLGLAILFMTIMAVVLLAAYYSPGTGHLFQN
jgi:hypothetical protein